MIALMAGVLINDFVLFQRHHKFHAPGLRVEFGVLDQVFVEQFVMRGTREPFGDAGLSAKNDWRAHVGAGNIVRTEITRLDQQRIAVPPGAGNAIERPDSGRRCRSAQ